MYHHLDQESIIDLITKGLGYKSENMRAISLNALLSHLSTGVISEESMYNNRNLLVRLFDLFTQPEFSQNEKLYELLLRLCRRKPAATFIHEFGCAYSLYQLSPAIANEKLRAKANQLIDIMIQTGYLTSSDCDDQLKPSDDTNVSNPTTSGDLISDEKKKFDDSDMIVDAIDSTRVRAFLASVWGS